MRFWFAFTNGHLAFGRKRAISGIITDHSLVTSYLDQARSYFVPPIQHRGRQKIDHGVTFEDFLYPFIAALSVRDINPNGNNALRGFDSAGSAHKLFGNLAHRQVPVEQVAMQFYNSILTLEMTVSNSTTKELAAMVLQKLQNGELLVFARDKEKLASEFVQNRLPALILRQLLKCQCKQDAFRSYLRRGTDPNAEIAPGKLARIRRLKQPIINISPASDRMAAKMNAPIMEIKQQLLEQEKKQASLRIERMYA